MSDNEGELGEDLHTRKAAETAALDTIYRQRDRRAVRARGRKLTLYHPGDLV